MQILGCYTWSYREVFFFLIKSYREVTRQTSKHYLLFEHFLETIFCKRLRANFPMEWRIRAMSLKDLPMLYQVLSKNNVITSWSNRVHEHNNTLAMLMKGFLFQSGSVLYINCELPQQQRKYYDYSLRLLCLCALSSHAIVPWNDCHSILRYFCSL